MMLANETWKRFAKRDSYQIQVRNSLQNNKLAIEEIQLLSFDRFSKDFFSNNLILE